MSELILAGFIVGAAGTWATTRIWDFAHHDRRDLQTRALLRRLEAWWANL